MRFFVLNLWKYDLLNEISSMGNMLIIIRKQQVK